MLFPAYRLLPADFANLAEIESTAQQHLDEIWLVAYGEFSPIKAFRECIALTIRPCCSRPFSRLAYCGAILGCQRVIVEGITML